MSNSLMGDKGLSRSLESCLNSQETHLSTLHKSKSSKFFAELKKHPGLFVYDATSSSSFVVIASSSLNS